MPYPKGIWKKYVGILLRVLPKHFVRMEYAISAPCYYERRWSYTWGFYSHFSNKEQLVLEACQYAIRDTISLLQQAADQEVKEPKIHAAIRYYLSAYHRDQTEMGCILPALSGEISRMSEEVRHVFTQEVKQMIDFFSADWQKSIIQREVHCSVCWLGQLYWLVLFMILNLVTACLPQGSSKPMRCWHPERIILYPNQKIRRSEKIVLLLRHLQICRLKSANSLLFQKLNE